MWVQHRPYYPLRCSNLKCAVKPDHWNKRGNKQLTKSCKTSDLNQLISRTFICAGCEWLLILPGLVWNQLPVTMPIFIQTCSELKPAEAVWLVPAQVLALVLWTVRRQRLLSAARLWQQHCCECTHLTWWHMNQRNTAAVLHIDVFIAERSLEARGSGDEAEQHDSFVYKKMAAVCLRSIGARDQSRSRLMLRRNFSYPYTQPSAAGLWFISTEHTMTRLWQKASLWGTQ